MSKRRLQIYYLKLLIKVCYIFYFLLLSTNYAYPDQLCSILISKSFFIQLLNASLSGDALFQSSALEIILSLAKAGKLLLFYYKIHSIY